MIHHSDHSREKEFFYVATVMKHGLTLNQSSLLTNKYNDNALIGQYLPALTNPKESLNTTKTNAVSDIFKSFKNNDGSTTIPKYILIEGAPGMGKTTLCKEIAYQWSANSLLKETELLFLIYLHDPNIMNINHIKDLVHYQYDFVEENTELSEQCAKVVTHRDGIDLTIVFDGYDEYNSSSDSIITKILDRKVLPQCRIIVTSRLTASNRLHRLADVRVEVLGFTDESKTQYIKQELMDNPNKIDELHSYLNTHTAIKSICYMPMMMTILVYIFKEKGCLPNNSTELYDKFIALTMCHHLQKHNISGEAFVTLENFPLEYKSVLTDLLKFAFLTLQNKQKVFSKEDIKNLCPNSLLASFNLESFGIINSIKYFSIDKGDGHALSFLHLSIHEYLAAYHLNSIDQCGQFKELETTFLNEMYQETWNMFVAMNKATWLNVQNYFIYCKDAYRESLSQWISNIQSSFLESFVELYNILNCNTISQKVVQVLLYENDQCVTNHDARQEQMYISLCDQRNVHQTKLQFFVIYKDLNSNWYELFENLINRFSMVLCMHHVLILSKSNHEQIQDIFKCNTSLTHMVLIDCHIANNTIDAIKLSCLQNLLYLQISRCSIECNAFVKLTIFVSSISTLSSITVNQGSKWSAEWTKLVCSVIVRNCNLKLLKLNNNHLQNEIIKVAKALKHTTTLEVLNLSENNIPESAATAISAIINSNTSLRAFYIGNNNLRSSIVTIVKCLDKISFLEVLDLRNNQIPEEAVETIASVVLHNPRLKELYLNDNNLGIGTVKVAKSLQHITTLKTLSLSSNNIPHEASEELALVIESNKQLEKLWLNDNYLHYSANVILNSLATITTLTMLDLNNNQIPQEAGEALASVIMHNTILEELYLHSNNLGIETIKVAKSLQHITTLKTLNLSSNNIPQEAFEELALVIESNKQLEKLWLNDNNLHSSANVILNSLATITTLTMLDLNNNQIPQEAGEALASVIMHNTILEELYLHSNNLGIETIKVAKSLQHITTLKTLNLSSNNIPQEAFEELALVIESNKQLEKLWLNDNNLHSSANVILNSLATITTLTVLGLSNNQLPQEAGEALASVIMHNTGLEELYLHSNNLGIGTVKVAKSLQVITTLKMLSLISNNIPHEAFEELALVIESNKQLEKLWLNDNYLHSSAIAILNSLATIATLTVLALNNNQIPREAGEAVASVIMHNTRLEELYLDSNNFGIATVKVAKSLQHTTTLRVLSLENNYIPQEACNEVALAIKSNIYFKQLYLHNNCLHSSLVLILQALQCFSNLSVISIYGNTVTEEAGNLLASVITRNTELKELQLNLLILPLKVTEALQSLSCLQRLVFCTCKMSEQIEIKLASVITMNKSLTWLSLVNIKLSQHVTLQAIATLSNLTTLWLEDNLLSEQMSNDLSLAISSNKSLEILILLDNMLQAGLIEIVKACNKLSNIKVLQLAHNCIIPSKAVELTSIITQNASLERVLLGGITLNAAECFHFNINEVLHKTDMTSYYNNTCCVTSSIHCASLEVIYLEMLRKQIDNTRKCLNDVPIYLNSKNFWFAQKIFHYFEHASITQLKIQEVKCKLAQVDAKKIIFSLVCILEKVKVIDLGNNNIDEDASFELATALHSNNVLEQLWLRGNKLNTAGALYILNSLEYLTTLQVLDLSYNNIGSESADAIAAVIDNNPLMNQLWLDGNDLYSIGTIIICNALKKIRTLSILSLCNNGITDDTADELSAVITHNILLEDLLLSNNQLQYTGIAIIAESLSKLIRLRKLDLLNNNISRQGASSLAIVLKNCTSLQDLFLSGNNLETSGALEICNALSHINSLHVLTLSNNNISDELTSQLIEVLNNNHLYALLIGGNDLECGALKIAQVIEKDNIAMQLLDFSNNNISEQDKEKIKVVFSKRANFQFYV